MLFTADGLVPDKEAVTLLRRKLAEGRALADLGGHSHWVWQARFNPQHDSLLLSASSDALVNLWYLPSLASGAPHSPILMKGAS